MRRNGTEMPLARKYFLAVCAHLGACALAHPLSMRCTAIEMSNRRDTMSTKQSVDYVSISLNEAFAVVRAAHIDISSGLCMRRGSVT